MRNVKKRESKGKGKELKGMKDQNVMTAIVMISVVLLLSLIINVSFQKT